MQWNYAAARRVGWIALVIAAAAYYPRFAKDAGDGPVLGGLALLRHGAQCLLSNQVLQDCDLAFTYPPFLASMMAPFFLMGQTAATVGWYLVAVLATIASYQICEALVRRLFDGEWSEHELAWLRTCSLILSLKFILAVLENQGFDELILLLIVIGLWGLVDKREIPAGLSFGVAAAMKASPLIFLPYLLGTRRYVAFAVMLGSYLALSFLPDLFFTPVGAPHGYYLTWFREIALGPLHDDTQISKYIFWSGPNSNNQSLRGLINRIFPDTFWDPRFRATVIATSITVLLVTSLMIWRSMKKGGLIAVDGAIVIIAMLALSPMTSRSHFVALMLPYTVCCAAVIREPQIRRSGITVLVVSFILATATGNDLVGGAFTDWAYNLGSITFGSLVLLVYLGLIANRGLSRAGVNAQPGGLSRVPG